jgi:hypothetical protein
MRRAPYSAAAVSSGYALAISFGPNEKVHSLGKVVNFSDACHTLASYGAVIGVGCAVVVAASDWMDQRD